MSNKTMGCPEPLRPLFDFSVAPEPACLFQGKLTLHWEGGSQTSEATVFLEFIPNPQLSIKAEFSDLPSSLCNQLRSRRPNVTYSLEGREIRGFVKSFNHVNEDVAKLCINPEEPLQVLGDMQTRTSISSIVHLFNFPDFLGKSDRSIPLPIGIETTFGFKQKRLQVK